MKKFLLLAVAVGLTLPLLYFLIDRIQFVSVAQTTPGTVEQVTAKNSTCKRRRYSRYACTLFRATIGYDVEGRHYRLQVAAGRARNHNQPISRAKYRKGERERVAFDPDRPSRAYRDTFWDIWGTPLMTFFVQLAALIAGRAEQRRKPGELRWR